jgi:hypothetical protein
MGHLHGVLALGEQPLVGQGVQHHPPTLVPTCGELGQGHAAAHHRLAPDQKVGVPSALAVPPKDPGAIPPRELAERYLTDLPRYTVLPRGGHFVAMEYLTSWPPTCRRSSPS